MNERQRVNTAEDFAKIQNMKFTPEELRVLEECSRESFYKRSLPLSTVLGLSTFVAVKTGYLSASGKFGPVPKMFGAVFVGYLIGKFSYRNECGRKLMQLPNSPLGEMLRKRFSVSEPVSNSVAYESSLPFENQEKAKFSDQSTTSSLNIDTDRPIFASLDDSNYRSSQDSSASLYDPLSTRPPSLSYDDLRKQNRDAQVNRHPNPYKVDEYAPPISRPQKEQQAKNQYGDEIN